MAPPLHTSPPPVLFKYIMESQVAAPKRTFLDDFGDFESLYSGGIPARAKRLKMHGVVMNVARLFGWLPKGDASGDVWAKSISRVLSTWRVIIARTPRDNIGVGAEGAIEDFRRHLDSSAGSGKLGAFCPRMPDFTTLPRFGDARATARGIRNRIIALMEAGILPSPEGGVGMRKHVASGASRIIVEVLCPLARRVPGQCLDGTAAISAARMQAMCPSRLRHKEVVAWLAATNILHATRTDFARWDKFLGRGRTRLYRVNLPLVIWLVGIRKDQLSWTASKGSGAPQVASKGGGGGQDATSVLGMS